MDILKAINEGTTRTIPNPNYNARTKKLGESPIIEVDDFTGNNSGVLVSDFRKAYNPLGYITEDEARKFTSLDLQPVIGITNLDKQLADVQSTGSKWWNAIKQTFWSEMALGTVKGFSDIFDYVVSGKLTGNDENNDYTNPFSTYLSNLQEEYKKNNPIFVDPDKNITNGGLFDAGWLASNFPSVASTVSLMVPGFAVSKGAKLLSAATGLNKAVGYSRRALTGLRNFEKLNEAQQIAKLGEMGKMTKWINTVGKDGANWLIENGINAATMRIAENYQESNQTYNQMYEQADAYFDSMTDEQWQNYVNEHQPKEQDIDYSSRDSAARGIAKKAADKTFQMDAINFFSDLLQLKALGDVGKLAKNTILTRGARKADRLARQALSKELGVTTATKTGIGTGIKNFISDYRPALLKGLGEISEGVEEAVNYIAQEEGLHYGNVMLGTEEDDNSFSNRLNSYLHSPQLYDAAFWGVMGGIIFQAAGGKYNQIRQVADKAISNISNKNKKGDEKSTTWSEAWELPTTKRQVSEINSRIQLAQSASDKIAQVGQDINPFTHEVIEDNGKREIVKEELRRKIIDDFITRTTVNAIDAGTYDNLVDFYYDDNVDRKLKDLGLIAEGSDVATKQDVIRKMSEVADSYQKNFTLVNSLSAAMNNGGVPMEYQQIIARDNTIAQREIDFIDKQIQRYKQDADVYNNIYKENLRQYGIETTDLANGEIIAAMLASDRIGRLKARRKAIIESGTRSAENDNILRQIDREIEAANRLMTMGREDKVATAARAIWAHGNALRYASDITGKHITTANTSEFNEFLSKINSAKPTNSFIKELTGTDFELTDEELTRLGEGKDSAFNVINDILFRVNKPVKDFTGNTATALEQAAPELYKTYLQISGLQMSKLESQRLLALTTPNISRRIQDLDNKLNNSRKVALDKAFGVLDKLADKYGSENVINYLWKNTPIEGITDAERVYLDDAAAIVDLQNEGNINLVNTLANRFLMKSLIKEDNEKVARENSSTFSNSNSEPQNPEPIVSTSEGLQGGTTQSKPENEPIPSTQPQPTSTPVGGRTTPTPSANTEDEFYTASVDLTTGQPVLTRTSKDEGNFSIETDDRNPNAPESILVPKDGNLNNIANLPNTTVKSLFDVEDTSLLNEDSKNWNVTYPFVQFDGNEFKVIQKGSITRKAPSASSPTGEVIGASTTGQAETSTQPIIEQAEEKKPQPEDIFIETLDEQAAADFDKSTALERELLAEFGSIVKDPANKDKSVKELYEEFHKKIDISYPNPDNIQKSAISSFDKVIKLRLEAKGALEKSVYDAAKASSITDITRNKDARKVAYEEFLKAAENLIDAYANKYNLPIIDGKTYVSIESLLRDLSNIYGNEIANLLYQNILNYVNNEGTNKYVLLDQTTNASEIIANVFKSRERRITEKVGQSGVYRLNIDRFYKDTKEYKEAFDSLSNGRKLEMKFDEDTHEILFSANGVVIGSMTVPKTDKGNYNLSVMGWDVSLTKEGDEIKSEVKDMLVDLLSSRYDKHYKRDDRTSLFNKLIEYTFNKSLNPERRKELVDSIDKALRRKYGKLFDKDGKSTKQDRVDFIANIFRYLDYSNDNSQEYKTYMNESINRMFNKIYDSYDTAFKVSQELSSGNIQATVNNVTLGEINKVAIPNQEGWYDINQLTPAVGTKNSDGSYGNNEALDTDGFDMYGRGPKKVAIAATSKQGNIVTTALNDQLEVPSFNRGNAIVVFTIDNQNIYVPAVSSFLFDSTRPVTGEAKKIANAVKNVLDELVEDYKNGDANAINNLLIFLNSLCGRTANEDIPNSLKRTLINTSTLCFGAKVAFDGDHIIFNSGKDNIFIYYAGENAGRITANGREVSPSNVTALTSALNNILSKLRFNISYNFLGNNADATNTNILSIAGEKSPNGLYQTVIRVAKPNGIGAGTEVYSITYNSFNEFALNSGIVRVDTKKVNGSNFKSKGNNQLANRTVNVEIKRTSSPVKGNEPVAVTTPEDKVITTVKSDNGVQELVKDAVGEKALNILNSNDLLPKSVIFEEELNKAETKTDKVTGRTFTTYTGSNAEFDPNKNVVKIGRRWASMYAETGEFADYKGEARKEAIKKLIHEQLHIKIQESDNKEELLKQIKGIFDEFKSSLNNVTDEKDKKVLEQYLYEGVNPLSEKGENYTEEDRLEEFLVESLTSDVLIEYLNDTKAEVDNVETKETLWTKILKVLNDIFGWNVEKGSLREKELIALSDIINKISIDTNNEQEGATQGTEETKTESETPTQERGEEFKLNNITTKKKTRRRGSTITDVTNRRPKTNSEYETELADIKAKAIADGTFMKAPNSNPTNLTERQWLQVRTKAFKDWFGDWFLNMDSFMPKRNWSIGHIIDNPTDAANICDNTQIKVLNYIRSIADNPSKGKINVKPVTIWAKSPINDKQIHHSTVAVRINDKVYLYDMPQSEYIKQIGFNKGEVISEYTPRLIEYNEENLKKYYGTSEETLHLQDEVVLDDDLENISFNASKVIDENGEPKVVYHSGPEGINIFRNEIYEDDIPTNIPNAIYTSDDLYVSGSYTMSFNDFIDDGTNEDPYYLERRKNKPAVKTYYLFSNIKHPLIIDAKGKEWNKIEYNGRIVSTRDLEYEIRMNNYDELTDYDGVIINNVIDAIDFYGDNPTSTVYIQFNPNQVKSATNNTGEFSNKNDDINDTRIPVMSVKTVADSLPLEDQAKFLERVNDAEYEISCKI